jgi:hypothetical protein
MAWFTSSTTKKKQVAINMGIITVLLLIKKWDKGAPMSLICAGADRANAHKIKASDDLFLLSLAYISTSWAPPS